MFGFKNSLAQSVVILAWILDNNTFGSVFVYNILVFTLCASVLLSVLMYDYDYWENRGVYSPPALPIVGHIGPVVAGKEQGGVCFQRLYNAYKEKRFFGIHQFYRRTLVVCEPELVRRMCVNDFAHFTDRGFFFDESLDPLAASVLYLRGNEWKRLRAKISPIFSPIKLKGMLPLIENTANDFVLRVKKLVNENNEPNTQIHNNQNGECCTEIYNQNKDGYEDNYINKQFTSESLKEEYINLKTSQNNNIHVLEQNESSKRECNNDRVEDYNKENSHYLNNNRKTESCKDKLTLEDSLIENNNIECYRIVDSDTLVGGYTADAIVPCAFGVKSHVMDNANDPFAVALGAFYELTFANIFEKTMRHLWPAFVLFFKIRIIPKKTHEFFYNIVSNVIKERQNGAQEKRGDFIDMMMALQSEDTTIIDKENDFVITDMIIAANAFIIFLGGYETTSSTLAFLLLELAAHPEVQQKMREEIAEVMQKHGGRVTSEALQDLTYMDMVIQETLRLYPPFPSIQRMCTRDYAVPGSDVLLTSGTIVVFPTLGLHRDEMYFENASLFVPTRWSSSAPPPGVYAPFGLGPRYCIGKRFAVIQMKTCLLKLLPHLRISPATSEPRTGPFPVDLRTPMTLHPADSRVRISLLS
ncbi:cytochrome P450 6B1 [Bicyclus anynana]|uniref:unspecific monooxygenase n=1 Tax=Bicyclus anynana TaxID=110368 RepID=A0A6J1NK55_BICAN|nr:cytochrome P450 6B1 [Bicyclus anynana]